MPLAFQQRNTPLREVTFRVSFGKPQNGQTSKHQHSYIYCFYTMCPGWRGAVRILSTVLTVDWVLLGSGESITGFGIWQPSVQLVALIVLGCSLLCAQIWGWWQARLIIEEAYLHHEPFHDCLTLAGKAYNNSDNDSNFYTSSSPYGLGTSSNKWITAFQFSPFLHSLHQSYACQ
jgi:hypothetical protein